jgi:hypothetical protein
MVGVSERLKDYVLLSTASLATRLEHACILQRGKLTVQWIGDNF